MIALDPNQTTDIHLAGDADKPEKLRPTFVTRYLTARQWIECDHLLKQASEAEPHVGLDCLLKALSLGLIEWKNIDGDFAVKKLPDMLTMDECWELVYAMIAAQRPEVEDLKKSVSQSESATEPPASTVKAVSV